MAAGALGASKSDGATMIVDEPEIGTDYTLLDMTITNNDSGAEYNSGVTNTTKPLAQQIATLNDATMSDMMGNWTYNISGDVTAGWSLTPQNDGSVYSGTVAPFGNDEWLESDTQIQSLGVNNSALESNLISGYQPFTLEAAANADANFGSNYDHTIFRSDSDIFSLSNYNGTVPASSIENAFVGTDQGGFNSWSANGPQYALINPNDFAAIPEPSTTGLLGLTLAAGLLSYRRREE